MRNQPHVQDSTVKKGHLGPQTGKKCPMDPYLKKGYKIVQMLTLFSPIPFQAANTFLESDSGSAMNKGSTIYKQRLFFFLIKKDTGFTDI